MQPVAVKPCWTTAAGGYGSFERFTGGFADDAIAKLLADPAVRAALPRDRAVSVLDIAAGTGAATFGFAEAVQRDAELVRAGVTLDMLATDFSAKMLDSLDKHARKQPIVAGGGGGGAVAIKTRVADMTDLSAAVPDGSVDVALCVFGVMFPPEPVKALAEIKRVLRPGTGVAVVVTWHYNGVLSILGELCVALGKIASEDDFSVPFMKFGDEGYMRRLVRDAGISADAVGYDFLQRAASAEGSDGSVISVDHLIATVNTNPAVSKYAPFEEDAARAFLECKSQQQTGGRGIPMAGTAVALTITAAA